MDYTVFCLLYQKMDVQGLINRLFSQVGHTQASSLEDQFLL